jgi:hypothetical protein
MTIFICTDLLGTMGKLKKTLRYFSATGGCTRQRKAASCAASQNIPIFYGTRRFITVFITALHWSLS